MRFVSFSRGVFESQSLTRKSREWGKRPRNYLLLLGAVLAIGGVIGGFKYWTSYGYAYGGSGNGSDFISPLSDSGAAEEGGSDDDEGAEEGTGEGTAEEGTGGSVEQGKTPSGQGGDRAGEEGTQGSGADRQSQQEAEGGDSAGDFRAGRAGYGQGGKGVEGGIEGESNQGSQPSGEIRGGTGEEFGGVFETSGSVRAGGKEKEALQAYLQEKSSPLGDYIDLLYQEELDAGILNLSRLVVAIAGAEQNFGKVPNFHNLWGIKCGSDTYCRYLSLEEGIQAISKLLSGPIYNLGEEATEEDIWRIASTYASDPKWGENVIYFFRRLDENKTP